MCLKTHLQREGLMEGLNKYKTKTGYKNPNFEEKRPSNNNYKCLSQI